MSTVRWWKNGDHPKDRTTEVEVTLPGGLVTTDLSEGKVVKRYAGAETPTDICPGCGQAFEVHGWVGGPKTGTIVHPGDYVTATSPYKATRPDRMKAATGKDR